MKFTDIFIRRPVLASVVSLLILVVGLRAISALPVLQYPRTENAVVTITTTYYGADPDVIAGFITTPLEQAMRADHYADGRAVWTPMVAMSLLVWFVLAMQCMSTLAVVRRETGGWKWPLFMLVYMNALAYVVSLAVYQVGTRFLHG